MLARATDWMVEHIEEMSAVMAAALLFIYSAPISRFIQKRVRPRHFFVRLAVFMLVCSFGCGLAMSAGTRVMSAFLGSVPEHGLLPVVVLLFMGIGFVAENKRHI